MTDYKRSEQGQFWDFLVGWLGSGSEGMHMRMPAEMKQF